MFASVRTRMLPAVARTEYGRAKVLFDARQHAEALAVFETVQSLLGDEALAEVPDRAGESELRLLAQEFAVITRARLELAKAAPPVATAVTTAPNTGHSTEGAAPRIYEATDGRVVAPVTLNQEVHLSST
jgi:hypothetical protein